MSHLPDFQPVGVKWINAPIWWKARKRPLSQIYPPIKKYGEYLILDECLGRDLFNKTWSENYWFRLWICIPGRLKLKVWKKEDHPNMKLLPDNVPRLVKRLYDQSFQLAYLRMTDCSSFIEAICLAEEAWKKYVDAVLRINQKGNIMNEQGAPKTETPDKVKEETLEQIMEKVVQKPSKEVK